MFSNLLMDFGSRRKSRTATTTVIPGFDHVENAKIRPANDCSAKMFESSRKQFWIPFYPGNRFTEPGLKFFCAAGLPGVVKIARVAEVKFDGLQEFNRLCPHLRETRRSSSESVRRLTRPFLYALQRWSRIARWDLLTGQPSSTPENHNSSASSRRWRLGNFANAGKSASFMGYMIFRVRIEGNSLIR